MAGIGEQIYNHAPVAFQHALVSAYGWHWRRLRFGGQFKAECHAFRERERYSADEWNAYVEQQLRALLVQAFARVPYYQTSWKGLVTQPQLERFTLRDIRALPPLEKSVARDDPRSLLLDGKPDRRHRVFHTSGTTGTPVATYWLPHELQRSLAIRETRSCAFAGVSFQMPRATFSGRMVEPRSRSKGPFYRYNWSEKQVYFSAFHLRPETASAYVEALWRHKICWLTGYSNSIYHLAQMVLDQGLQAPALKAVITTSEQATPEMRAIIQRAFATKVLEEYGSVESVFFVSENDRGHKLVSPDAGLLEVVDNEFRACDPGVEGEVLGTGFIRPSQPMIRYRIGDRASFDGEPPADGYHMPVLREIVGGQEDIMYGIDGQQLVRFHGVFSEQPNVRQGQIIQKNLEHIHVKIVPKPGFGENDECDVIARVQRRLTSPMRVTVEKVDTLELTRTGKIKAVVSELSPRELSRIKSGLGVGE